MSESTFADKLSHVRALQINLEASGQYDDAVALAAVLARLGEIENRSTWRPISEIHEDFGSCVLWNGDELRVGTNLDSDFDEADYLCFVPVPILTHVAVARLIDKTQPIEEIRAGLASRADAQGEG